jgi:hypothetical protein
MEEDELEAAAERRDGTSSFRCNARVYFLS